MKNRSFKRRSTIKKALMRVLRFLLGEQIKADSGRWKKVHYLEKWED